MERKIIQIIPAPRRSFKLEIEDNGEIVLQVPMNLTNSEIELFLKKHKNWLNNSIAKLIINKKNQQERKYKENENFMLLGNLFPLTIKKYITVNFKFDGEKFIISEKIQDKAKEYFEKFYRQKAKEIIIPRTFEIAQNIGIQYNNIAIKNVKTRWGSCSSKGNLNFSYRLIMAKPEVIDYVITHEIFHLIELNHSEKFWNLVSQKIPNYKEHEKWLQKNSKYFIL